MTARRIRCIGPGRLPNQPCGALLIEALDGQARVTCDRCHWTNEIDTVTGEHWISPPGRELTARPAVVMMSTKVR